MIANDYVHEETQNEHTGNGEAYVQRDEAETREKSGLEEELRRVFEVYDTDNDGVLSTSDFVAMMIRNDPDVDINYLVQLMDPESKGYISMDQFVSVSKQIADEGSSSKVARTSSFNSDNNTGQIDVFESDSFYKELLSRSREAQNELDFCLSEIERLKYIVQFYEQSCAQLQEENDDMKRDVAEIKKDARKKAALLQTTKKMEEALKESLEEVENENKKLQRAHSQTIVEKQKYVAELKAKELDLSRLTSVEPSLESPDSSHTQIVELKMLLKARDSESEATEIELQVLREQMRRLTKEKEILESQVVELQAINEDLAKTKQQVEDSVLEISQIFEDPEHKGSLFDDIKTSLLNDSTDVSNGTDEVQEIAENNPKHNVEAGKVITEISTADTQTNTEEHEINKISTQTNNEVLEIKETSTQTTNGDNNVHEITETSTQTTANIPEITEISTQTIHEDIIIQTQNTNVQENNTIATNKMDLYIQKLKEDKLRAAAKNKVKPKKQQIEIKQVAHDFEEPCCCIMN